MSAVSSGFRAHCGMHSEKSAISLSMRIAVSNQGSLEIVSGQDRHQLVEYVEQILATSAGPRGQLV
jgi:hypothetical protein